MCVMVVPSYTQTGTYGFNLENPNNNYRYLASWTHSIPGGWQFNYVVVPWNDSAGFDPSLATATMTARWVLEAGANARPHSYQPVDKCS